MAQVNFRLDNEVKHEADELFGNLGMTLSTAITIFIKQSLSRRGLPFAVLEGGRLPPYGAAEPEAAGRKAALRALAGSWVDDRSADEIVDEIVQHRTKGRVVEL